MMPARLVTILTGVCAIAAFGCARQQPTASPPPPTASQSSGPNSASSLVTTTATVENVDQKTRMVTLRTADGEIVHFQADDSVRNLPQVRKGDQVTATYYESIALSMHEAPGGTPSITVAEGVERAPLGDKPAGMIVRDTTITAKVTAINKAKQTVTLEGPQGGQVTLKAADPANLDHIQVGHLVQAVYREAVSISVEKPTKQ